MPNYGWVQNTSNLSTIRDTIDLVPEHGIRHGDLRTKIKEHRSALGNLPKRWTWDARCRIKAIHATGLVKLNRNIQGYELTDIGRQLKACPKSKEIKRGFRTLSSEEVKTFRKGLLTNTPVIRVLRLLYDDYKDKNKGLSKYDIGMQLGFVGDVGFTHIDPHWVASQGYSFNNKEGDADKWARTILSWLVQVGWAKEKGYCNIKGKKLKLYTADDVVDRVLRYDIKSIKRNVPSEMLCSDHHPFPELIQRRRTLIIKTLISGVSTLEQLKQKLLSVGMEADNTVCEFEILNLRNAGFTITQDGGYYKLCDRIELDIPPLPPSPKEKVTETEKLIEKLVVKYDDTIPPKLVDHLIRFGYDGARASEFESNVSEFFNFLGYETNYLGQGHGRVPDVLVKYKDPSTYANSYALLVDAKATSEKYAFPASDKRKMIEYVRTHGPQLLSEHIPNHAFTFVSSQFVDEVKPHLNEITKMTNIGGCAITVIILLEMGSKIIKQQLRIKNLYKKFVTNNLLAV